MKLPVLNAEGKQVRQIEVDESVFGLAPNGAALHQAFVAQQANQRWGTAQTKTRGEVRGSTRKVRKQKYTGRSRQGSARAPHRVGGGRAFGPRQRDYSPSLPKKMRRLAIRSALSGKVADGQLVVIDKLAFERPKTKEMLRVLRNVGIQRSALVVTGEADRTVLASVRNLEKTKVLPAAYLNVVDVLTHRDVLMTQEAVRAAEGLWGRKAAVAAAVAEEAPRRRRAAKAEVPAALPEAPPAEEAPKRRRATKAEAPAALPEAPPAEEAPPTRRRRAVTAGQGEAAAEKAPARPRRRAAAEEQAAGPPAAGKAGPRAAAPPSGRRRAPKSEPREEG